VSISKQNLGDPLLQMPAGALRREPSVGVVGAVQAVTVAPRVFAWRWAIISVFVLASTLNYLDRQLLAAVAPSLRGEFRLSNADYGAIVAAFSITYTLVAPVAGWLVDRVGLKLGTMASVACWSLVSLLTGGVGSYRALLGCRMALGVAEAAGIPASSKSTAVYLQPREFGLGMALQAVGATVGMMAAPLIVAVAAPAFGWRSAFVICGVASLLWLPLFWLVSRRLGGASATSGEAAPVALRDVIVDRRFWGIIAANVLVMATHSLWMNWTTIYFVERFHLTQTEANQYFAWIPPIFASLGGFFGGWLGLRQVDKGGDVVRARLRICTVVAPMMLVTALVPLAGSPILAAAAISASFFVCLTFLNNLHVIPMDVFGPQRAAFTAAALASSYALMQTGLSPAMGRVVDTAGFGLLCGSIAVLPLVAILLLRMAFKGA